MQVGNAATTVDWPLPSPKYSPNWPSPHTPPGHVTEPQNFSAPSEFGFWDHTAAEIAHERF